MGRSKSYWLSLVALQLVLMTLPTWGYSCSKETVTGSFGSLSGGNKYGCSKKTYDINLGTTMAVKMTWLTFDNIPGDMPYCSDGYIKVYAGCGQYSWDRTEIAEFCSGNMISSLPHDIYAYTNCLRLELKSPYSYSPKGTFSVTWSQYSYGLSSCTTGLDTKTSSAGVMATPNWPSSSTYLSTCSWKLDRSESNGYLIHVMDIKDQTYSSYCSSSKQQITIKDEDSYSYGKDICTRDNGINYYKPTVKITYKRGTDWNKRGVVVGWVAFNNPYYTNYGSIGGYIAAGILIPLVLICIIVCVCLKQKRGYVFSQRAAFNNMTPQANNMTVVNNQTATNTTSLNEGAKNYPAQQYVPPPQQPAYPPPQQGAYPPQGYAPPPGSYPPPGAYPPPMQGYPPVSQQGYAPPPSYQESVPAQPPAQ